VYPKKITFFQSLSAIISTRKKTSTPPQNRSFWRPNNVRKHKKRRELTQKCCEIGAIALIHIAKYLMQIYIRFLNRCQDVKLSFPLSFSWWFIRSKREHIRCWICSLCFKSRFSGYP